MKPKTKEQAAIAYKMRNDGITFAEIGRCLGISQSRASVLYLYWKDRINLPSFKADLSLRLQNILHDVDSKQDALNLYIKWDNNRSRWPRNYGWKSHQEMAAMLGLPKPEKIQNSAIAFATQS